LDPHNVAGLLKLYFRELPEPVLTRDLSHEFNCALSNFLFSVFVCIFVFVFVFDGSSLHFQSRLSRSARNEKNHQRSTWEITSCQQNSS